MYSCCSLMCSDHEFALWPCSLPLRPLRPPQWRPVRWRLWSVCPRHTPRPEWAKLWSWRTRRWPWSSSSSPTSKRSVLLCLPKNDDIFVPERRGEVMWTVPGFLCRSWRRRRNAQDKRGSLVRRRKRTRSRPLSAHRELQRRGRHFYLNTPSPSIQSNKQPLFKVIK